MASLVRCLHWRSWTGTISLHSYGLRQQHSHRLEGAQFFDTGLNHVLDLLRIRDIGDSGTRFPAHGLDLSYHFVYARLVCLDVVDAHVVAIIG